jgi:hypothetical protein
MFIFMTAELQIRQDGGREIPPPARRRLRPASDIKAKLPLCSLGYAERKILSGENQNRYLMLFDDLHGFTALQAGAKRELCC